MLPITRKRRHTTGLPNTGAIWRFFSCRRTGRNSTPPNAFGTIRANTPRITDSSRNLNICAKFSFAPLTTYADIPRKLKTSSGLFVDRNVYLFMRGYIARHLYDSQLARDPHPHPENPIPCHLASQDTCPNHWQFGIASTR